METSKDRDWAVRVADVGEAIRVAELKLSGVKKDELDARRVREAVEGHLSELRKEFTRMVHERVDPALMMQLMAPKQRG